MIRRSSVNKFLKRPRDSHNAWKSLTAAELDKRAKALPARPPIWSGLKPRQKVGLLLGAQYKRFAFLSDTGTGKTMLCIALSRYFREIGAKGLFLALVPNKSNKDEWAREIEKHSPSSRALILRGSSEQKWRVLRETKADIVVETYAGLIRMLCVEEVTKKGIVRLKPNRAAVRELGRLLSGLFLDESTSIKNRAKLPYRICRALAKQAEYCFVLTGTPFGRDPTDLWAQMFLIDWGHSLGETLGLFRAAFFEEKETYWKVEYHFDKSKEALLHKFLAHRSIRYEIDPNEMPKVYEYNIKVPMSVEASDYYAQHRQHLMNARGNYREMDNAFTRMRQISSGFLGYKDDDSGEKAQFEFSSKPKLDRLKRFLWRHAGKAVIFHEYRYTGRLLSRMLTAEGIGHEILNGSTSDDSKRILARFDQDPDCEVLGVNNAAGGFGLNLQTAKWAIFYESPVSAIIRRQAERRVERQFSSHRWIGIVDLITKGTVDEQILEFHREGGNLFQSIVQGKARPV